MSSDLWPPEPEDPQPLPSDSSGARFFFALTPGLPASGLGSASWLWSCVRFRCALSAVLVLSCPFGRISVPLSRSCTNPVYILRKLSEAQVLARPV